MILGQNRCRTFAFAKILSRAKRIFLHLVLTFPLITIALASPVSAQDLFARAEGQAEVLAAAPKVELGAIAFPGPAMREGAFAWLTVLGDGLYILRLSSPGSLALMSFPNASGDFAWRTWRDGTGIESGKEDM